MMTTLSSTGEAKAQVAPGRATRARYLMASEWTKTASLRSTYFTLAAAAILTVLVGVLVSSADVSDWNQMPETQRAHLDPLQVSMKGLALSGLVVAMLGVMAVTSEYTTGLIRTTLAAVPHRRALLAAKAAVIGAITLVFGEATAVVAFLLTQARLHARNAGVSITGHNVLPTVLAAGFYLTAIALVGVGVGAMIRHTAGALGVMVALLFVLPQLVYVLPSPSGRWFDEAMPSNAGLTITSLLHSPGPALSPDQAIALLLGYVAAALLGGLYSIVRRDA